MLREHQTISQLTQYTNIRSVSEQSVDAVSHFGVQAAMKGHSDVCLDLWKAGGLPEKRDSFGKRLPPSPSHRSF